MQVMTISPDMSCDSAVSTTSLVSQDKSGDIESWSTHPGSNMLSYWWLIDPMYSGIYTGNTHLEYYTSLEAIL